MSLSTCGLLLAVMSPVGGRSRISGSAGRRRRALVAVAASGVTVAATALLSPSTAAVRPPAALRATAAPAPACPTPPRAAVRVAPGAGRTVALTFDDGPSPVTPQVLDVLTTHRVHATFFVVGDRIATGATTLRRIAREGHLIGNHSWDHAFASSVEGGWTRAYLLHSMGRTTAAVQRTTGQRPCWFRPPGGAMPSTVLPAARQRGMGVSLWSVDTRDWEVQAAFAGSTPADRRAMATLIARRALAGTAQPHPVILLHDGGGGYRGATVAALRRVILGYKAAGYRFVRLDGRS